MQSMPAQTFVLKGKLFLFCLLTADKSSYVLVVFPQ